MWEVTVLVPEFNWGGFLAELVCGPLFRGLL